jgi:hypothetical protein
VSRRKPRPTKREARGVVIAERQHSQSCRFAFGLECTCAPELVIVGTAHNASELGALLRERFERLEAIKSSIVRGFS